MVIKIPGKIASRLLAPSLKKQIFFSFLVMSILILSLSSIAVYQKMLNTIKFNLEQSSDQQFQQMEYNIRDFMNQVDKVSRLLMNDESIRNFVEEKYESDVESVQVTAKSITTINELINMYDYIQSVYLLTESGKILEVSLDSGYSVEVHNKEHKLFQSDIYRLADNDFPKMIWVGGKKKEDFVIQNRFSSKEADRHLISASRGIRMKYGAGKVATLIINIDQQRFNSLYNNSKNSASIIYIMNETNNIISHIQPSYIGQKSIPFSNHTITGTKDAFTFYSDSQPIQCIYYKIQGTDWIMVNEVPLNRYIQDILDLRNVLIVIFAASLIIAVVLSTGMSRRITKPLRRLTEAMRKMEEGQLGLTLYEKAGSELDIIIQQFNQMSRSVKELVEQVGHIKEEKKQRELEALQAQINPHFLYNTLNTIKWLAAGQRTDETVECVSALGNLLRQVFKSFQPLCLIEEEIKYLENYIRVMQFRFGDSIWIQFEIPQEIKRCQILRFILQPLIENALSHGFNQSSSMGEINIRAYMNEGDLMLEVADNGIGIAETRLQEIFQSLDSTSGDSITASGSIGLTNVNRRIKLHFGDQYGVTIRSDLNAGTSVLLKMPYICKA